MKIRQVFLAPLISTLLSLSSFGKPVEVIKVDRVLVDATPRTLEQLGIAVSDNVVALSLMNVGSQNIYYAISEAPNVGNPTVGAPTSPFMPTSYGGVNFILTARGAKKLQFRAPTGQTSQMQVQQEGSGE